MKSMTVLSTLIQTACAKLGTNEIPSQQLLILAAVAERPDLPMAELQKVTGMVQSSVSRNVAKLGLGESPRDPGYGLIEAFEDPYYRKRKLVRLTPRGHEVVKAMEKAVVRWLKLAA